MNVKQKPFMNKTFHIHFLPSANGKKILKTPFSGKHLAFSKIFDSNHALHREMWVFKSSHSFEIRMKNCVHKIVNNQKSLCRLNSLIFKLKP